MHGVGFAVRPARDRAAPHHSRSAPDDTTIDEVIAEAPPAPVQEAESDDTVTLDLGGATVPLVDAAGYVATPTT